MKIIKSKWIFLCNDKFDILEDKAIAFSDKILEIGDEDELKIKFKNAKFYDFKDSLIAPAFINPHVHLEFSANKTSLVYGDFLHWLSSIITNRNELSGKANEKIIKSAIFTMQKSGVGTIGAVSSFGAELNACVKSGSRVVYFNEILGSNEQFLEPISENFLKRFDESVKFKSELFIPAVSVHSPYSTHPKIAKIALNLAKEQNLLISTHLMESDHERDWLESGGGKFKDWLVKFNPNATPMYDVNGFISQFSGLRTLFTHCVYLRDFSAFDRSLHSVTHCAFSNRLLSKKSLNLKNLIDEKIPFHIGTDGLSSNISLNFFDELRANLLIHSDFDPLILAKILILAATKGAANALNLELGEIKQGKIADLAIYDGFEKCDISQLPLMFLLHTKECKGIYIGGRELNLDKMAN